MEKTTNQHFKNLLSIALSDGILDKSELDFIFKKSGKYFITQEDFDNNIDNHMHVKPGVIESKEERSDKMLDLIEMMLLDGETHENERRLCIMFGVSLGYDATKIEELVDSATNMLEDGKSRKKILSEIQTYA
jgi:uncharacterized tellurite resistance protein B-like protein